MCNVFRLGLQKEEQVAVCLGPVVIGKGTHVEIGGIFEVVGDFISLCDMSVMVVFLS